jgi:hypothetical protein
LVPAVSYAWAACSGLISIDTVTIGSSLTVSYFYATAQAPLMSATILCTVNGRLLRPAINASGPLLIIKIPLAIPLRIQLNHYPDALIISITIRIDNIYIQFA